MDEVSSPDIRASSAPRCSLRSCLPQTIFLRNHSSRSYHPDPDQPVVGSIKQKPTGKDCVGVSVFLRMPDLASIIAPFFCEEAGWAFSKPFFPEQMATIYMKDMAETTLATGSPVESPKKIMFLHGKRTQMPAMP